MLVQGCTSAGLVHSARQFFNCLAAVYCYQSSFIYHASSLYAPLTATVSGYLSRSIAGVVWSGPLLARPAADWRGFLLRLENETSFSSYLSANYVFWPTLIRKNDTGSNNIKEDLCNKVRYRHVSCSCLLDYERCCKLLKYVYEPTQLTD